MRGLVTARDVFAHPILIVTAFGWRVFGRAVLASCHRRPSTFLSCVFAGLH